MPSLAIATSAQADLARIYTRNGEFALAKAEIDGLKASRTGSEELINTLLADWHLRQNQIAEDTPGVEAACLGRLGAMRL